MADSRSLPLKLHKQAMPHVRRRCRQHAQVAETFEATVRAAHWSLLLAKPPTAFLSPSPGAVTTLRVVMPSSLFEDITMTSSTSSRVLYRIDECPDLMTDGCVGDEQGNLVFLSVWARDTAVQEFLARLTLGRS